MTIPRARKVDRDDFPYLISNALMILAIDHPEYTIAQHLCHILRAKGKYRNEYYWANWDVYHRLKAYEKELKKDIKQDFLKKIESSPLPPEN